MPVYDYWCSACSHTLEVIQPLGGQDPPCPMCGEAMSKKPSFPVMVKIQGGGGYPSRRKFVKGTAPYTTRSTKAWLDSDPFEANKET